MKKSFSVFTLVMLLAVQILTPVTYAVGDEEFVEESIVQEETPEDVEEVSDDVDDETDDVDLDEEEDEDSLSEEEDGFSGDVVDDDSLEMSGDIIPDAESESGDVVVIDSESGAVAATGSEVVVESSVDVSGTSGAAGTSESSVTVDDEFITKLSKQGSVAKIAEELGINWYTDSSEWAIKAGIEGKYLGTKEQNNIIREYFIQHAREILGAQESNEVVNEDVIEEPEVVIELNKEEISGRKYYNGVTAIVLAPVNTFPEGTTLSIVPIKAKKDLNEIKEQLVDQQDEVTEDSTVVAFDISFMFSGEEVQPVSGQTVQVTFNYGNHEKLTEANENETEELKVYHLNDKDGSGNKVEDIKEVKVEAVETIKNEEGELVVDAESFSIYTIVTQVAEEGPEALEDQLANFEYGMISIARPDSLSGTYPAITGFTIMDRNLGAEETGFGSTASTGSYGYHYQWGNNYGFISYTGLTDEYKTGNKIDVSGKTEYSGNQFVYGSSNYTWTNIDENLWGEGGQGPCPDGWHVPTATEWSQLLEFYVGYYNENFSSEISLNGDDYKYLSSNSVFDSGFSHYFQIPFASYRDYSTAEVNLQDSDARLWSSSPYSSDSRFARNLRLASSYVGADTYGYRASGLSVRCFKDDYVYVDVNSNVHTITFNFNGGSGSTASINVVSGDILDMPSDPVKSGFIFDGWYSGDVKVVFSETSPVITEDITLTARYNCAAGTKLVGEICSNDVAVLKKNFRVETFKTLAGDLNYIRKIIRSAVAPLEGFGAVDIGVLGYPQIKAWFDADNGIIYYYTVASSIFFQDGDASNAFGWMPNLEYIDLSGINTSDVTTMKQMFFHQGDLNNSLKVLDLSNFDTSKVTDMSGMFGGLKALKTIYVSSKFVVDNVTTDSNMFNGLSLIYGGNGTKHPGDGAGNGKNWAKIDDENQSGYFTDPNHFAVKITSKTTGVASDKQWLGMGETITPLENGDMYYFYTTASNQPFNTSTPLNAYTELNVEGKYKVDFDLNGGNGEVESQFVSVNSQATAPTLTPTKDLYQFAYWYLNDENASFDFNNSITSNITLKAKWNKLQTEYTFNANGGEFTTAGEHKQIYSIGSGLTSENTPSLKNRVGYTFEGWYTDSENGDKVEIVGESNATLYAHWKKINYTIKFDADGATTGSDSTDTLTIDDSITFPNAVVYEKPYQHGIGWGVYSGNTNLWSCGEDCSDPRIVETFVTLNNTISGILSGDSITFRVIYDDNNYSVHFNANGGEGTMNNQSFVGSTSGNLTVNSFTKYGYHFTGWSLSEGENDVVYLDNQEVSKLTKANNGVVELYAQWEKNVHKVTFDTTTNGGSSIENNTINVSYLDKIVVPEIIDPKKNSWEFVGWSLTGNNTGFVDLEMYEMPDEDVTLYAVYKKKVEITFVGNGNKIIGDSGLEDTVTVSCDKYNNDSTCPIPIPGIRANENTPNVLGYKETESTGSNYVLLGGVILNEGNVADGVSVQVASNGTYYAHTTAHSKTFSVHYKSGDNKVDHFSKNSDFCTIASTYNGQPQDTSCEVVAPYITSYDDTVGYFVYGVNGRINGGDKFNLLSTTDIYAYTTGVQYGITYVLDGGVWKDGEVATGSYQKGASFSLPVPEKKDYTFIGWTYGNIDTPSLDVSILPDDTGNKTFYANWRKDVYTISYYGLGFDLPDGLPTSYTYGGNTQIPALNTTRDGYTFSGWTTVDGGEPQMTVVISSTTSGDLQYWATWDEDKYAIAYNLNGGAIEGEVNPEIYTITTPTFTLNNPTRVNSIFEGWMLGDSTTAIKGVTISQGSFGDRSYTAKYSCDEGYLENDNECVAVEYNVDYALKGGVSLDQQQLKVSKSNNKYSVTLYNPVKTGFNFVGWSTTLNNFKCKNQADNVLDSCVSSSNNPITLEFYKGQDVTLTANWEHVNVKVIKGDVVNGALMNGTTVSENVLGYTDNVYLNASNIDGYITSGWTTSLTGNKIYENGLSQKVSQFEAYIEYQEPTRISGGIGTLNLYAIREPITYKIIYDVDGGINDASNPTTRTIEDVSFDLKNASKIGYDFSAWIDKYGRITSKIDKELLKTIEYPYEIVLKAVWTPRTDTAYTVYHVKQDLNGEYHTGNEQLTNTLNLQGTTGSPVTPEVESYVGFTSPQQTTKDIAPDGTMYIIYQYPRDKYDYTFVEGVTGAKTDGTTSSAIIFFEAPIVLSGEINTGYTWSGWNIQSGDETLFVADKHYEFTMPLNNVTVTPVVEHNKWSVEFDVNEGTGDVVLSGNEYPMYYDDEITYPVVTRLGYTFTGWYDDVNNVRYDGTDKKMPNANLKLTAHWEANDYTLNVEHYLMNLDGENYTEDVASKVVIATKTDATVTEGVSAKDFTGYTLSGVSLESVHMNPVEGDAMTIKYYYSRDKHNVTVNENEGVTLSGTKSGEYYYGSTINVEGKVKEGYTWSGWNVSTGTDEPIFTTDTGVIKVLGTGDLVFTPLTTINSYHLTVKNDGAIIFSGDVVYKTNIAQYLVQPTKNGYTFNGWTNRPTNDLMPAKDLVVEAKWTYKSNGGGGGGGGGSSYSSSSEKKTFYNTTGANEQTHGSAELTGDNKNVDSTSKEETTVENEKSIKDMNFEELKDVKADQLNKVDRTKLTKEENEILDAYQWAYEHNVTTMVSLRDANPEGIVTRGHLAKMVVNYATNVLGQQIPEKIPSECRWSDGKKDWESDEIKDYAVKACALGLMGLDMKKFSPNLRVTRAQFGTIMSRLLWGKKYAGGTPYYRKHLNALKLHNIMTQIQNPEGRVELRQWVWLMLMRAGEEK